MTDNKGVGLVPKTSRFLYVIGACAVFGACGEGVNIRGVGASAAPTLLFSPSGGAPGTMLTVTGEDFTNLTSMKVGTTSALILSKTTSTAKILVMPGTVTSTLSAVMGGATKSSGTPFSMTVTPSISQQQGTKLTGTGAVGAAYEGIAVAVSADGNTAITGGILDNGQVGAAWVYTRTSGTWAQQGTKLLPSDETGSGRAGSSVALSADGDTALVGGYYDNAQIGAAFVYTRTAGVWSQQGTKLVGTGGVGAGQQGYAVALSADGNTAVVGAPKDNTDVGAAWIFTRSAGVWTQSGSKFVGTAAVGASFQGSAVAISADGKTIAVGGRKDNSSVGAVWMLTISGAVWSQLGSKLVGTGNVGGSEQGSGLSLSADGETLAVGAGHDNTDIGAAWIFVRSSGVYAQQGSKLVGTGGVGVRLGMWGVGISADGNRLVGGGAQDNTNQGAVWTFQRSAGAWSQVGSKLIGTGNVGAAQQGYAIALTPNGSTLVSGGYDDNSSAGATWIFVP